MQVNYARMACGRNLYVINTITFMSLSGIIRPRAAYISPLPLSPLPIEIAYSDMFISLFLKQLKNS